jgi:hypothetical protein
VVAGESPAQTQRVAGPLAQRHVSQRMRAPAYTDGSRMPNRFRLGTIELLNTVVSGRQ